MVYDPNTPANSSEDPSQSQPKITANFQEINTYTSVNHVVFNDADQGKHKFLQLPEQGAAPTTSANEGGLYTKVVSGNTQLFFREESNGTERQLTSAFTASTNGRVTIPGGLVFQWGLASGVGNDATINYPVAFSTAIYNIQLTLRRGDTSSRFVYVDTGSETTTNFRIKTNAGSTDVYWYAIGR